MKLRTYKAGDVVVWSGHNPAIGRVAHDFDSNAARCHVQECTALQDENGGRHPAYNSLHYSNLRPATKLERRALGAFNILVLGQHTPDISTWPYYPAH